MEAMQGEAEGEAMLSGGNLLKERLLLGRRSGVNVFRSDGEWQ